MYVADFGGDGDSNLFVYQSGSRRKGKPAGYSKMTGRFPEDNGDRNAIYENVGGKFERAIAVG